MGYYKMIPLSETYNGVSVAEQDKGFIFLEKTQGDLGYFEFPDFEPVFSGLHLTKHAIPPDFIYDGGGFGGKGYILSEKAMQIIKDFNLPPHRFYKLPNYVYDGNTYSYYWIQILVGDTNYDFIDFKDSVFQIDFWEPERTEEFRFEDADQMEAAYKEYNMPAEELYEKEVALSDAFHTKAPDLFYIDYVFDEFVISERLKNALEQNGITGLTNFDENRARVKGSLPENGKSKETIPATQKEIFIPKNLEQVKEKLDFVFAQMTRDENAIYEFDQEIAASLAFLSKTDDPIKPVFAFLEKYPEANHGAPGDFAHYLENFYGKGKDYEAILTESVARKPSFFTIHLLYRMITDTENPDREKYIALLKSLTDKDKYDAYIAETAQDFISDL